MRCAFTYCLFVPLSINTNRTYSEAGSAACDVGIAGNFIGVCCCGIFPNIRLPAGSPVPFTITYCGGGGGCWPSRNEGWFELCGGIYGTKSTPGGFWNAVLGVAGELTRKVAPDVGIGLGSTGLPGPYDCVTTDVRDGVILTLWSDVATVLWGILGSAIWTDDDVAAGDTDSTLCFGTTTYFFPFILTIVWVGRVAEVLSTMVVTGGLGFTDGDNFTVGDSCIVDDGGSHVVTPPTIDWVFVTVFVILHGTVTTFPSCNRCSLGGLQGAGCTEFVVAELRVLIGVSGGGDKLKGRRKLLELFFEVFVDGFCILLSFWQFWKK